MRWQLDQLESFLGVLDTGSVTAAAARANLSKSVVSARVSALEQALGAALFNRSAGRITPTEAALRLADRLRPALLALHSAAEEAGGSEGSLSGRLSIAAPMSFGTMYLGPILANFAGRHPGLDIVLDLDDRTVDLSAGRHDAAIRIGALSDGAIIAQRLCRDPRAVVAGPDYVARHGAPASVAELARHEAVIYPNLPMAQMWRFAEPEATVPRPGRITANNGEALRDMAAAGLGIAVLPLFLVAPALADGRLVQLLPESMPVPLDISVVRPPLKPAPAKTRALIAHLRAAFAAGCPWDRPAAHEAPARHGG